MRNPPLLPPALRDAPLAMAAVSRSGRVREANGAFQRLLARLHLRRATLAGAWRRWLLPVPAEHTLRVEEQALQLRSWPLERGSGARRLWLVVLEPLPAGHAALEWEALRQREARYRSVFEHSLEGVLLTRPSGEVLAANPAACQLLGCTEAELRAAGRQGVIAPDDARLPELLETRRRTGQFRGELWMVRKDGSRFPADLSSSVFRDGSGEEVTCLLFRDLTERQRGQAALEFLVHAGQELGRSLDYERTLEVLTRLVVPTLADLCMVDLVEGDRTRRVAIAHRDPAQAATLRARSFDLGAEDPGVGIARVSRTGQPELVREVDDRWLHQAIRNTSHVRAAAEVRPRSVMHVPLIDQGKTLGVLTLAVVKDNPRRFDEADLPLAQGLADRAAQAIHHARLFAAAVEAKKLRDDVLAVVSHDLRNPLYTISLSTELLARQRPSPQLAVIRSSVLRADRLIEDLLLASALDQGALPLERELEPVGTLVQESAGLHRAQAEEREIELVAEVELGLPLVPLDHHRMLQLLGNLLGNALKFAPRGGRIGVSARRVEDTLELSVQDNGPGIPPEDLPHLFNRFWQGGHDRRAGVGLGLSIAKGIAESHGGAIRVESAPGRGARFVVTLPLGTPAEQATHQS